MDDTYSIATVDAHERGTLAFRLTVTASGARFFVMPHRDPLQPRFWCVVVAKCAPSGMVDPSESGYIAQRQVSRDDLVGALAAIRMNLDAWLAEPSWELLREWLISSPPAPVWDPQNGWQPLMETID